MVSSIGFGIVGGLSDAERLELLRRVSALPGVESVQALASGSDVAAVKLHFIAKVNGDHHPADVAATISRLAGIQYATPHAERGMGF